MRVKGHRISVFSPISKENPKQNILIILDGEREKRTNTLLNDREVKKMRRKECEAIAVKKKLQKSKCLFKIKWDYSQNHLRRQD